MFDLQPPRHISTLHISGVGGTAPLQRQLDIDRTNRSPSRAPLARVLPRWSMGGVLSSERRWLPCRIPMLHGAKGNL
jgi:hypothetical protein